MWRLTFGLICVLSLITANAQAQVATVASTVGAPFDTKRPITELDILTTHYNNGDWVALQRAALTLVTGVVAAAPPPANEALNVQRNHLALTWLGRNAFGDTLVMRFIVHTPAPELFSPDLPGIHDSSSSGFYELLLTRTREGESASVYVSTRENDPFVEGLPEFIQAIASPLFATFSAIAGRVGVTKETVAPTTLTATIKRVGLPFKRASIAMRAVVTRSMVRSSGIPTRPCAPGRQSQLRRRALLALRPCVCVGAR